MKNAFVRWSVMPIFALAACGDNSSNSPDAPPPVDAAVDAPGGMPFTPPTPVAVMLSAMGPDQLQSATAAPGGKFYAAGFAATTPTGPRMITVIKYGAAGLDTTFDGDGIVTTTVEFAGGLDEIDITTQPNGKILVSATVASASNPADRDIAVIRLLDTGAPDPSFSGDGIAVVNLNDAFDNAGTLLSPDAARAITANADAIFVHAISRGVGERTIGGPRRDTDFTVVKLDNAGEVDEAFGVDGEFRLDILESPATPRAIQVLADGKLLVAGYSNTPEVNSVQPVLYKLTAAGQLDLGFAVRGFFHDIVLAMQTEIYGFAIHGNTVVTAGYGRSTGTLNDYISLRFNLETGARDLTWGATNGAVVFDPSGMAQGNTCRFGFALPNGKTMMLGTTGTAGQPAQDAVFAVLDATGKLDTTYGTGIHRLPLGSNGIDQFWGGALSGDQVTLVGFKGSASQTEASNDDSFRAVFTVR